MSADGKGHRPLVVITDCDHGSFEPERGVLGDRYELRIEQCVTAEDVAALARDADALINQYAPLDTTALTGLDRCRVIARYGVGIEHIDLAAAEAQGIWVANVPDYGVDEVADHALALTLAAFRQVVRLDREVRSGAWDFGVVRPLRRLSTRTVGVIGAGRIGLAYARRVHGLGFRVLVHDVRAVGVDELPPGVEQVPLDELLGAADLVSVHVPGGTGWSLGAAELDLMRPGGYVVNTARGAVVDADAVRAALDRGHLAGAALDVLAVEPPAADDPLLVHPAVVLTPHAAWYSEEAFTTLKTEVAREVDRVLSGGLPRSPVNSPVLEVR
jgi:D-3-phosphoglycerate dehydrogenase